MAKITRKDYRAQLKDRILKDMKKDFGHGNKTVRGLDFWFEYNKTRKEAFESELKSKNITVEETWQTTSTNTGGIVHTAGLSLPSKSKP